MGKYMKKTRAAEGRMEAMTQGQLGVRTRARAQAIERIKEVITSSSNNKVSSSSLTTTLAPAQTSYLELRSRRLEKTVLVCAGDKLPFTHETACSDECRRLSDVTNSDILADDSTSRLAIPGGEARRTRRQTVLGGDDENEQHSGHCHELAAASLFHGFIRSPQQWGRRGRALASVAHSRSNSRSNSITPSSVANSRSNSRSNSVTRELPTPTGDLPPQGILTRNQRKKEKQFSDTIVCSNGVADINTELDTFYPAEGLPASSNLDNCQARHIDFELGFGKEALDEGSFARERLFGEEIPISDAVEVNTASFFVRLSPELTAHDKQAAPSNTASPTDIEIEDFFLQAETQQRRHFIEQYNFDPEKDSPLPGQYDWVRL